MWKDGLVASKSLPSSSTVLNLNLSFIVGQTYATAYFRCYKADLFQRTLNWNYLFLNSVFTLFFFSETMKTRSSLLETVWFCALYLEKKRCHFRLNCKYGYHCHKCKVLKHSNLKLCDMCRCCVNCQTALRSFSK